MSGPTKRFEVLVNGRAERVDGEDPHRTLLQWLRANGHTGTKEGCAEGDCGACSVALVDRDAEGRTTYRAINACITLLPMVAGREIVTVEGVGRPGELHPVQDAMVRNYGSQCGYCTPGFVVAMFEGFHRPELNDAAGICDQLSGNLCRCTGYRPIREAMAEALACRGTCPPDAHRERLAREAGELAPLLYETEAGRFSRPTTLEALLATKARDSEAELIAGATELGVLVTKRQRRWAHLVSTDGVRALSEIRETEDAWLIGGNATLTAIEERVAGEYPSLAKMLSVFAARQIRNRATLAGNLVTASPIGDLAPVLLSLDASIVLEKQDGSRTVPLADFFVAYRRTVLARDEIVRWIVLPRRVRSERRREGSYKVSKRRELDISIVAAAFVIETDGANIVTHARLGYGGVAPTPARARRTEAFLVGRPWTEATLRAALDVLGIEFTPIDDTRSGAEFRRGLVCSLFEKFFRGEESEAQDHPFSWTSSDAAPTLSDDSRALVHDSAVGHVTGTALYVDDVASKRRMLELWPVTSPHAHARLRSVDTSAAEQMPGVVCVLTAKDVPGVNDVGAVRHDEPLFAETETMFHGHLVAVVVAESLAEARRAAQEVIVDAEPLPAILGISAAIAAGSFHTEPSAIRRGDCAGALATAPHLLEGEFELGGQEHFYLESQAATAEPGDDGDVFVTSSSQHPSEIQAVVSHVLGVPRHRVVVQSPRMGGGFGGKETQGSTWAALCALAAVRTGRPVRVQLDRDLDMQLTGKRHPFHARFTVGYDDGGRLLAARVRLVCDGGWALDLSHSILDRALFHLDNAYYVPSVDFVGQVAKTNVTSHTAFRGFGGPQGMLVIEEILDRVARRLGLPPDVVRERNLYRGTGASNTTHYGQSLGDERLPTIWRQLVRTSQFAERRAEIDAWNTAHPYVKRGLAITPVKFGISFTATFLNQAGALVHVYRDGTVQVNHGGTEMGQGLHAKILGIAMRELGLPASMVRVMKTQTDKVPNTSATAASSGSDLNGQAVKAACETLRARLLPVAAAKVGELLGREVDPTEVVIADGQVFAASSPEGRVAFAVVAEAAYVQQLSLSATGYYRTPGIGWDAKAGKGRPFHYFAYGAAVSEVEVDGLSGMKRVRRVDILHDVGESLNPGIDRGQIEGGFVQGMGWLTGEELKWDAQGRLLTHSASTYQIPSIGDAPADVRVTLLPNAAQDEVIHGSKAVGEPPLMLAMSVREAIRDAIAAFGEPGGEVELPSPATHEAIFTSIRKRLARVPEPVREVGT